MAPVFRKFSGSEYPYKLAAILLHYTDKKTVIVPDHLQYSFTHNIHIRSLIAASVNKLPGKIKTTF